MMFFPITALINPTAHRALVLQVVLNIELVVFSLSIAA